LIFHEGALVSSETRRVTKKAGIVAALGFVADFDFTFARRLRLALASVLGSLQAIFIRNRISFLNHH